MTPNAFSASLIKALMACHRYPKGAFLLFLLLLGLAVMGFAWRW
jgi:hypothetical protein